MDGLEKQQLETIANDLAEASCGYDFSLLLEAVQEAVTKLGNLLSK